MLQTSISKMIFATAESPIAQKSIATVTVEAKLAVANAIAQTAIIAQVSQILRKTQIHNPKRRLRWNDLFYIFDLNLSKGGKLSIIKEVRQKMEN